MTQLVEYRYPCLTEGKDITEWRTDDQPPPTKCKNSDHHAVNLTKLTIINRQDILPLLDQDGRLQPSQRVVDSATSTMFIKLKGDSQHPCEMKIGLFNMLSQGRYYIDPTQANVTYNWDEDYIFAEIVDIDNITGLGHGTVLVRKAEDYITKSNSWVTFNTIGEQRQPIPIGLYLRVGISSASVIPIKFKGNVRMEQQF